MVTSHFSRLAVWLLSGFMIGCYSSIGNYSSSTKATHRPPTIKHTFKFEITDECGGLLVDSALIKISEGVLDPTRQTIFADNGIAWYIVDKEVTVLDYLADTLFPEVSIEYEIIKAGFQQASGYELSMYGTIAADEDDSPHVIDVELKRAPMGGRKDYNNSYGSTSIPGHVWDKEHFTEIRLYYKSPSYLLKEFHQKAEVQMWTDKEKAVAMLKLSLIEGGQFTLSIFSKIIDFADPDNYRIIAIQNGERKLDNDINNSFITPDYLGAFGQYVSEISVNITNNIEMKQLEAFVINKILNKRYTYSIYPDSLFNPNCGSL